MYWKWFLTIYNFWEAEPTAFSSVRESTWKHAVAPVSYPFSRIALFFRPKSWTIRWLAIERNKVKQGSHKHKNNSKKKTEIKWGERKERRRRKKCNRTAQHSTAQESNRKKKKLRLTLIYICLEQATSFTHQCEKLMWKFAFYFLGEQSTCV